MNDKTDWRAFYFCVKCEQELKGSEKMHNCGVCPHCGHDSNSTICNTKTRVARWVTTYRPPWWVFWESPEVHLEFKEND